MYLPGIGFKFYNLGSCRFYGVEYKNWTAVETNYTDSVEAPYTLE
jgi:hypothetical protein